MKQNDVKVNVQAGAPPLFLLFLLFLALKLCNVIDWSWWWVTSPLWIPFAIVIFFFMLIAGMALLFGEKK
jgi:hypothetical protein